MNKRSKGSDFQVDLEQGGSLARRKTELLPDGAYRFEDQLKVEGVLTATIITCTAWLLELYELQAGEVFFISGQEKIRPYTNHFGVFYPPFTITRPSLQDVSAHVVGIAAMESLPATLTTAPVVFDLASTKQPSSVAGAIETVAAGINRQGVEVSPGLSLLSLKAKKLIDENHLVFPSIARISRRLGVSHEHLSRQFKRDFGMSPSDYLRRLRVADASLRLARGEEIINVSFDVGYNDLSRFYKQFRKTTDFSPGECKAIMRPNNNESSKLKLGTRRD